MGMFYPVSVYLQFSIVDCFWNIQFQMRWLLSWMQYGTLDWSIHHLGSIWSWFQPNTEAKIASIDELLLMLWYQIYSISPILFRSKRKKDLLYMCLPKNNTLSWRTSSVYEETQCTWSEFHPRLQRRWILIYVIVLPVCKQTTYFLYSRCVCRQTLIYCNRQSIHHGTDITL